MGREAESGSGSDRGTGSGAEGRVRLTATPGEQRRPQRGGKRRDRELRQPPQWVVLAVLLVYSVAVMAVAMTAGQYVWFGVALIVVPVVAAGLLSAFWTLIAGVVCSVALLVDYGLADPSDERLGDWMTISSVAAVSVICVAMARMRALRIRTLARARISIEVLQRALLPSLPLSGSGVTVDGFYAAADAEGLVGGDLYEAVDSPFGTRLLIGDVQGKGLEAVGTAASVLAAFREASYYQPGLEDVAGRLEEAVVRHHRRNSAADGEPRFVTALLLELDGADGLRVVDCGHVPPLLFGGPDGRPATEVPLYETGLPLGLAALTERPRRAEVLKRAGQQVLLCTDGVTEARDARGDFYPLAERLDRWAGEGPVALLRALRADLERHVGGDLGDDATALVVTVTGEAPPEA